MHQNLNIPLQHTLANASGDYGKCMGNPNVNWKKAPKWAKAWLMHSSGVCVWVDVEQNLPTDEGCFEYGNSWTRVSTAPSFGFNGWWHESLTLRSNSANTIQINNHLSIALDEKMELITITTTNPLESVAIRADEVAPVIQAIKQLQCHL